MYELLILSRLMYGPDHGYRIAKITNDIIGPWARISPGTLYPVLARLERAGYIIAAGEEDGGSDSRRTSRTYAITPGGRMRFHQLMMDTTSNPGDYQRLFHLKVPYMEFLEPRERLHLLAHYITYCEAAVLYLQSEMHDLMEAAAAGYPVGTDHLEAAVDLMQHQTNQWQAEADWTRRIRERTAARIEEGDNQQGNRMEEGNDPEEDRMDTARGGDVKPWTLE